MKTVSFKVKDSDEEVLIPADQVEEIVPDADMRFSLVILKNDEKLFVRGTEAEVRGLLHIEK